jgi:hypothetical protein
MMPIPVMAMVMMMVVVMSPRGVRIIIAAVETDSSIAATAGNQESQAAEDEERSRYHRGAPSAFLRASPRGIGTPRRPRATSRPERRRPRPGARVLHGAHRVQRWYRLFS